MFRYFSLFCGLLFILFSVVQLNDPDPMVWIGIYGLVSIMSFLAFFKKIGALPFWLLIPLFLAGSIYLWPSKYEGISMPMHTKPGIEEARESLGLAIAVACMMAQAFWLKNKKSSTPSVTL
ncbi:MAG: transmembrane 220 family protein [Cytophagaceae bacterium]|jgi:hypothetical protein|nr:transmembrane 220 family protein [Cytophagaceae bacterium]